MRAISLLMVRGVLLAVAALPTPGVAAKKELRSGVTTPAARTDADRSAKDLLRQIDGQVGVIERSRRTVLDADRVIAAKTDEKALAAVRRDYAKTVAQGISVLATDVRNTKPGPAGDEKRREIGEKMRKAAKGLAEAPFVDYGLASMKAQQDRARAMQRIGQANRNVMWGMAALIARSRGLSPEVRRYVVSRLLALSRRIDRAMGAMPARGSGGAAAGGDPREHSDHDFGMSRGGGTSGQNGGGKGDRGKSGGPASHEAPDRNPGRADHKGEGPNMYQN